MTIIALPRKILLAARNQTTFGYRWDDALSVAEAIDIVMAYNSSEADAVTLSDEMLLSYLLDMPESVTLSEGLVLAWPQVGLDDSITMGESLSIFVPKPQGINSRSINSHPIG